MMGRKNGTKSVGQSRKDRGGKGPMHGSKKVGKSLGHTKKK